MNEQNRRLKTYTLKDGTTVLLSDGCRRCNSYGNKLREALGTARSPLTPKEP